VGTLICFHLQNCVYIKLASRKHAGRAFQLLNGSYYEGKDTFYLPVTLALSLWGTSFSLCDF